MSLDLADTALQIDRMAAELVARQEDRRHRVERALAAARAFDVDGYEAKRQASKDVLAWSLPVAVDAPGARYDPPVTPSDFCVVSVDGSHIDVDRHLPAQCFLINVGVCVLTYGSASDARLSSRPALYARDDELVIRDDASYREQAVEGAVLGAKRTVEEIRALAEAVRDLPADLPTLAIMDGSLIMLGLLGYGNRQFVLRELIDEGFAQALEELRDLASERPLTVASYISLPAASEVVNALRLSPCPYEVANCDAHCGQLRAGSRPCDEVAWGVRDRDVFARILEPGQRSGILASTSSLVAEHYQGHDVYFFYVNAGEEIGRVEVPSWVARDEAALGLAHALVVDQCRRGPGYPIGLMEAHEQAVVTTADRQFFVQQVEEALSDRRMPVYTSEKNRSKRIRWL